MRKFAFLKKKNNSVRKLQIPRNADVFTKRKPFSAILYYGLCGFYRGPSHKNILSYAPNIAVKYIAKYAQK